jgi:hypothetical protein
VGDKRCTIVDTWWQTETGGHLCSPLPGITPMKPGSCTLPFYGIELALVDPATGKEVDGNEVEGVLCVKRPWPSMTRTVYGDHERYLTVYMKPYKGEVGSAGPLGGRGRLSHLSCPVLSWSWYALSRHVMIYVASHRIMQATTSRATARGGTRTDTTGSRAA